MSDLTLEEKTRYASNRAVQLEAEKHFYDAGQPFFPFGFSIGYRNPGHWDVYAVQAPGAAAAFMTANPGGSTSQKDRQSERAFAIRGEPGKVYIRDERWNPHIDSGAPERIINFRSVMAAMVWICEELMQEPKR